MVLTTLPFAVTVLSGVHAPSLSAAAHASVRRVTGTVAAAGVGAFPPGLDGLATSGYPTATHAAMRRRKPTKSPRKFRHERSPSDGPVTGALHHGEGVKVEGME